ncbi:MAG TPA: DUF1549 domain-containing protein [Pirellulales bacterium]|nr:DUF1549 domain-containing protein [Pirellulales bacterium]
MRLLRKSLFQMRYLFRLAQPIMLLFGATVPAATDAKALFGAEQPSPTKHFDEQLAPLLVRNCLGCHNTSDKKGGLDLTRAEGLTAGGDSGPAVVPGDADASLLWQRVLGDEMPPERKPPATGPKLTAAEKELLRSWIADGAKWGSGPIDWLKLSTPSRAGVDWWSLQPIVAPKTPDVQRSDEIVQPIDAFILARLESLGLQPSPPADRRTLFRRLSFDLIGLPPTPDEVEAFVADPSPRAYEDLVDRLLASPHYGERWARHWLDVVRYAESQGFERDRLRPNSWQYRDWVVNATNDDLPYDEFIRWQLAGDVLHPGDPRALIATGFLVAAPWDEVGQSQQSEAMKAVVRQDELEDLVGTTCQTFLGLTVNCARCHDHKFDPVSQTDYYRIAAALSGVRHGERPTLLPGEHPDVDQMRATLEREQAGLRTRLEAIDAPVRQRLLGERRPPAPPPAPIARWEFDGDAHDDLGALHAQLHGGARIENGGLVLPGGDAFATTAPLDRPLVAKTLEAWVRLADLDQRGGGVIGIQSPDGAKFDAIVYGEREDRRWVAGSNFFIRTQDVGGDAETEAATRLVHVAVVYAPDNSITIYRDGRPYGRSYQTTRLEPFKPGEARIVFGLRHSPPGPNKILAGTIDRAALYDRALTPDEVAASAGLQPVTVSDNEIWAAMTGAERSERGRLLFELSLVEIRRRLLVAGPAYAIVPSQPKLTHVLRRGDTRQPADVVSAGGVAAVCPGKAEFGLSPDAPEAERRLKLAEWIAAPDNSLTARVIANRLWHYHFGVGLVDTPNDFGFNGGRPSHGDLLDWLAAELIRQKWSLKKLHRTIVLSAAYRRSASYQSDAAKVDAANRLLWRKSPLRLEAEILRDAILSVAGQLNPMMGGAGYRDFRTFTNNSQFYEVYDAEGFAYQRRSLYRTVIRSGTSPLLDAFDCPDPSTIAPSRAVTTTPLQALSLLNDSFVLRMADRFAERLKAEAGAEVGAQVERAYRLALARTPRGDELAAAQTFVTDHGLAAFCRVLFNSNEFLYID